MLRATVAHAATARAPGERPHALLLGPVVPGSLPAPRDPRRAHKDWGAGPPTPVITFQCRQLSGPEETPARTQPERRALPRRRAPGRSRRPRRPRGPERSPQCSAPRALRRARAPRAPCAFAPWPQGRPASAPTCLSAKRGGTGRPRSNSAPAWSAAPAPSPPAAPRPAPSHLPRRAAPLRQPAAPQSPLPDFHFLSL